MEVPFDIVDILNSQEVRITFLSSSTGWIDFLQRHGQVKLNKSIINPQRERQL